ncbi:hypothetical protein GCK32_007369 [Trichostrongylus colubriformis]|uniref:Uncharacterized protein n=1 Tax=Trichostrongylus colubriformis TaxID=6319 RepID=A0AAN8GEJ0_TRICO
MRNEVLWIVRSLRKYCLSLQSPGSQPERCGRSQLAQTLGRRSWIQRTNSDFNLRFGTSIPWFSQINDSLN